MLCFLLSFFFFFFYVCSACWYWHLSLSYNACSLIAELLQRGQGKSTSSGKDIFQFKYGLFIELLGQGWALMYLLCHRENEAFTCPEYLALHAFQRFEWPSFPQVNVFLFYLRDLCQLSKTLIDGEVYYQRIGETMPQQFSDIPPPMRIYRQRKTCWLRCFHIRQRF